MSMRHDVRAVTDALPVGEWTRIDSIYAALPEPKPSYESLPGLLKSMTALGMLERRGERGRKNAPGYEYRSGPQPVTDLRNERRGKRMEHTKQLGFMALARLEREDPAEYARQVARLDEAA